MNSRFASLDCRDLADGITVRVKVQPRASRNGITGIAGESLKIALTSPPVDGAANAACLQFFAQFCDVAKSRVTIASGEKSREKVVRITGISKDSFLAILQKSD